jgi:hypothetical protein
LLTVSALLPSSWERRLVDTNVESLKASHIDWADMIFITGMLVFKQTLRLVFAGGLAPCSSRNIKPDVSHLLGVFTFESPVSLDPLTPEPEVTKPRAEGAKDEQHAEGHKKNGKPQNDK